MSLNKRQLNGDDPKKPGNIKGNKPLYNYTGAVNSGADPQNGHWPTVGNDGMWLKSMDHPTAWKEYMYYSMNPELNRAVTPVVNPEGYFGDRQLQYVPRQRFGGKTYKHGGPHDDKAKNPKALPGKDITVKQGDGQLRPMNTASSEYSNAYAKNNILRVSPDDPTLYNAGYLPEVVVTAEQLTPWERRYQSIVNTVQNAPDYWDRFTRTVNPYLNAVNRKTGLPIFPTALGADENIGHDDIVYDLTDRTLDYSTTSRIPEGYNILMGGDFINEGGNPSARTAGSWLAAPGDQTYGDDGYKVKDIESYYGVEDGKFKVGTADKFKKETTIVPNRYGAGKVHTATLTKDGEFRIVDANNNPLYQNTQGGGKAILHDSTTGKSQFISFNKPEKGVTYVNSFIKDNPDAQYIVLDNGRFRDYGYNEQGLPTSTYDNYYQQDHDRGPNVGYNIVAKRMGGGYNPWEDLIKEGRAARTATGYKWKAPEKNEFLMELSDDAIEFYERLGYKVEYVEGGDVITPGDGWEYKREGSNYLAKKQGSDKWITTTPGSRAYNSISANIYGNVEDAPAGTPISVKKEKTGDSDYVTKLQQKLVAAGYDLGTYGANKDGVDGVMGDATQKALDLYNKGISPQAVVDNSKGLNADEVVNKITKADPEQLEDGYLPILTGYGEEACSKKGGCSYNASRKLMQIMDGNIDDVTKLWAEDAWFNKDKQLNDNGSLVYSTDIRDYNSMPDVPKDLYAKLQVGDYVHLNRANTQSSYKYMKKKSDKGYSNEAIEHMGFIIGKDEDGTPLIYHGSETGHAYVQRLDQQISLPDENLNYKISSIVRNPELKNLNEEVKNKIENSKYYKPLDPNLKIEWDQDDVEKGYVTETQAEAFEAVNKNIKKFKDLGYDPVDVVKMGQLLGAGIMGMETKGNTGTGYWKRNLWKQPVAYVAKDVLDWDYAKSFEGDEASWGVYQMKAGYNFTDGKGNPNELGKKLIDLGIHPDNIFDNIENQTVAGQLLLLENYKTLKKDKNFNKETGLYKDKLPAEYMLAKTWSSGPTWYNRDKYQKWIDLADITYSEKALGQKAIAYSKIGGIDPLDQLYAAEGKAIAEKNKAYINKDIAEGKLPSNYWEVQAQKQADAEALHKKRVAEEGYNYMAKDIQKDIIADSGTYAAESTGINKPIIYGTENVWDNLPEVNEYGIKKADAMAGKKPVAAVRKAPPARVVRGPQGYMSVNPSYEGFGVNANVISTFRKQGGSIDDIYSYLEQRMNRR